MKTAFDSSANIRASKPYDLELLLEAARRANWEAKYGSALQKSGRFFISEELNAHASDRLESQASRSKP